MVEGFANAAPFPSQCVVLVKSYQLCSTLTVLNTSDDDNGDDEDTKRVIITKKLEET